MSANSWLKNANRASNCERNLKISIASWTDQSREQTNSQAPNNQIVFLALTPGVRSIIKPDRAVIYPSTRFVELRVELEERESTPPLLSRSREGR